MSNIETGDLLKAYDDAKSAHVETVKSDQAKAASSGAVMQPLSMGGILTGFCASWEADKAALTAVMFWLNWFYPAAALAVKGLEAVGDQLHATACPKP